MKKTLMLQGKQYEVDVREHKGSFEVEVEGTVYRIDLSQTTQSGFTSVLVDGKSFEVGCIPLKEGDYRLVIGHDEYEVMFREAIVAASASAGEAVVTAPMPGLVIDVKTSAGERVKRGQVLLILEAMKMQNELTAEVDGVVSEVNVKKGDTVSLGQKLVVIEPQEGEG